MSGRSLGGGIVVAIGLFASTAWAGDFTVILLQKGSGDPIEGATVVLGKSGVVEMSDDKGEVHFKDAVLPAALKVLQPGYDVVEREAANAEKPLTIFMNMVSREIEGIEVVADRIQEKVSKITLSENELRMAPGTQGDPLKVLQSLPGVVTANEGSGQIYVRGGEPDQTIVWVNRAAIGYLYHFGGLHSTISPGLVKDFNMFLGGFPVEYGDALGAALDVTLRTPKRDRLHQQYSLGTYESSATLEGPLFGKNGKDSFYLSGRRSYIDLILSPDSFSKIVSQDSESDEEHENKITEVPSFYDIQAAWDHETHNGRLLLQHFRAGDEIRIRLNSVKDTDPQAKGDLESRIGYNSTSLVWFANWSEKLSSVSSLYLIRTSSKLRLGTDSTGSPFYLDIAQSNLIWQPETRWHYSDDASVTAGFQAVHAQAPIKAYISRPPGFDDINYNITRSEKFLIDRTYTSALFSPYLKQTQVWLGRLTTQTGMRATFLKSNGREDLHDYSPRFSAEYALTDNTLLTGSWGRFLQLPDGAQWVEDVGNPRLPFLKAEHRIVGVKHKIQEGLNIQVEAFQKPMKDLVVQYDEFPRPDNYAASGTGEAHGLDVLIKQDSINGQFGWLSYSYLRASRTEKGETFPFLGDQRHTLALVWSQALKGDWRQWNLGFRMRASSGKPYTALVGRTGVCSSANTFTNCAGQANANTDPTFSHWSPKWGAHNGSRLPTFYQLDVRVDREARFNTWKMSFYLDVLNVLNTQNVSGYDYGDSFERINNPKTKYALPLFPSIGIEAVF